MDSRCHGYTVMSASKGHVWVVSIGSAKEHLSFKLCLRGFSIDPQGYAPDAYIQVQLCTYLDLHLSKRIQSTKYTERQKKLMYFRTILTSIHCLKINHIWTHIAIALLIKHI